MKEKKSKPISLRLSMKENNQIAESANAANMFVSEYIRQSALKSTITVNPHAQQLSHMLCEIADMIDGIQHVKKNNTELKDALNELTEGVIETWQYLK